MDCYRQDSMHQAPCFLMRSTRYVHVEVPRTSTKPVGESSLKCSYKWTVCTKDVLFLALDWQLVGQRLFTL